MNRDDSEFNAYLAARWPAIVRTLVFLGHPDRDAHAIALDGLVRIYPDWYRLHREEDVDVAVYREVLDARDRHLRRTESDEDGVAQPPAAGAVPPGLAEQVERRQEVEAALDAMTPGDRLVVVLEHVAELSEDQVADVLDTHVGARPRLADADVRLALEAVPVDPLHAEDVARSARDRRRRIWTRTLGAVAALVLVVAGVSWVIDRTSRSVGEIAAADNPLPFAWYADGLLHLAEVTVEVRPVLQLVIVPDGVVMSDDSGDVTMVDDSGEMEKIGETVPDTALVVEPDNGWVAWADPGTGEPELIVHDTRLDEEIGRRSLSDPGEGAGQPVGGTGPIAIDEERVYFRTRDGDLVWEPLIGDTTALSGTLVDRAGDARISEAVGGYLLQAEAIRGFTNVTGTQGRLTPDGRYAFVVENDETFVYDVDTGEQLPRMYSPNDHAEAWTYADGRFWFAVLLQDNQSQNELQMTDQGDYRIYECVPGRADACVQRAEVSGTVPEAPVLAR